MKKLLCMLLAIALGTPIFSVAIGTLKITNLPGNVSSVTIDGKVQTINKTQLQGGFLSYKVLQGKHTVKITIPGKDDYVSTINVGKNSAITPTFSESAVYGKAADTTLSDKRFVGRGYDYFSDYAMETKIKEEVLDFDKMNADGLLDLRSVNKMEIKEIYGKTASEYSKSYKIGAGVEGGYAGFSASLETEFGEASTNSEMTAFTTIQGMFYHYKENIKSSYVDAKTLKKYLNNHAKDRINNAKTVDDAKKVFNSFGTHVILGDYQGGRVNYSSKTNSTSVSSAKDFSIAVKAKYSGTFEAGGSVSTNISSEMKNAAENAENHCLAYGGNTQYGFEIKKQEYKPWSEGLSNKETWTLCDFPQEDEGQALFPIWELCDNESTKEIFKKAFDTWANDRKYVIPSKTKEQLYIVDLRRVSVRNDADMPAETMDIDADGKTWYRLGSDFNWTFGKQDNKICLYYRLGKKSEGPITSIAVWGAEKDISVDKGFTDVGGDMNAAGRGGYYVRLGYKKESDSSLYITGLKQTIYLYDKKNKKHRTDQTNYSKNATNVSNWTKLKNQKELSTDMDFNKGNGSGSTYIYLYYTRDPIGIDKE